MSEPDTAVPIVQRALELRRAGKDFEVADLCGGDPELIHVVQNALDMSDILPHELKDPLLGSTFNDRYRLEEFIGAGAMGKVFAGQDESLGREVAVKILQHGIFATDQRRERFVREARVLASLDHPHIVGIFDQGETEDGFHYIVMERLNGASLASVLEDQIARVGEAQEDGPKPTTAGSAPKQPDWLTQIAAWGVQIASALQSAHDAGVYHRDLKPSNILIDDAGDAHLLDFGIAMREGEESITFGGTTLGTPWYMAPEQAADARDVNQQVDIYGLAATLYHLSTLEPPYDGDYRKVLIDLQNRDPRPPKHVRPELPLDLCAIIEKGMERDLRRRYQNGADLGQDLRAFLAHLPVTARPLSPIGRKWRRIQARPMPWVAAVVVILALVTTFFVSRNVAEANRDATAAAEQVYQTLFAGWAPAVTFEGNLQTRPLLDSKERAADIARADRILELRPDDQWSRMLRAALWLDAGETPKSTRDIEHFRQAHDTEFFRALLAVYRSADPSVKGAGAIHLDNLPDPTTDTGRFVAAFHFARIKNAKAAEAFLARATDHLAARYLRLSVLYTLAINQGRDPDLLATVENEARDLTDVIGFPTARTTYCIGMSRYLLRNYGSAIDPLRQSAALCESFHALFSLASSLRRIDGKEEAVDCLERAARLRPWNLNAFVQLAQVKAELGEFDEAREIALSLPSKGHLIKPWHREYVLGVIEAWRAEAQIFGGDRPKALQSVAQSKTHYENSLAAAIDSDSRSWALDGLANLRSIADPDGARVLKLTADLQDDPLNVHYLRSLHFGLERFPIDFELQAELLKVFAAMAKALDRRRHKKRAVEATVHKK